VRILITASAALTELELQQQFRLVLDPFGVLEEGQIHFRSSQELGDPLTETNIYSVRGPVLVSYYFVASSSVIRLCTG
jgi:hypothetical protein